jgi:hypothetical protein
MNIRAIRLAPCGLVVALLLSLLTLMCGAGLIWLPWPAWSVGEGARAVLGVVLLVAGMQLSLALALSLAEISARHLERRAVPATGVEYENGTSTMSTGSNHPYDIVA